MEWVGLSGKSSLIRKILKQNFMSEYMPTLEEVKQVEYHYHGKTFRVSLFDIQGIDDFNSAIDNLIRKCEAFILVFSMTKTSTFNKVEIIKNRIYSNKYTMDFRQIPIVVVGTVTRQQSGSIQGPGSQLEPHSRL